MHPLITLASNLPIEGPGSLTYRGETGDVAVKIYDSHVIYCNWDNFKKERETVNHYGGSTHRDCHQPTPLVTCPILGIPRADFLYFCI